MQKHTLAFDLCIALMVVFSAPVWSLPQSPQDQGAVILPSEVKAVWDLDKAYHETTPTRDKICINGLWLWQPAEEQTEQVPDSHWGYFKVPGCWPGITDYMQKDSQSVFAHPVWKDVNLGSVTMAWYQRQIEVPVAWAGQRIAVSAETVNSYAAVYVDGVKAGEILFPAGELDITGLCRAGETHRLSLLVAALPLKSVMLSYSDSATAKRIKGFGINFVYTHNYGCEPGAHLSFSEILRAADDLGMLVAMTMPHFSHYEWDAPDANTQNGYARHAAFYAKVAQNHPSVVMYATSHNACGYSEDMNPDMIDGLQNKRDRWAMNNVKKAIRAESLIKQLDASRIVYHHAGGNLGAMHTSNFYPNFVPVQELSDWFEHWAAQGVKPLFLCEYGAPFSWDWAMYRGWYDGKREFGSAVVPWEFCQMDVTGRTEPDPAARMLTANLINYVSTWKPKLSRDAIYVGDPVGKSHLLAAGIQLDDDRGNDLNPNRLLILGPGSQGLLPSQSDMGAFLKPGGVMLAIGLTQAEADATLPFEVSINPSEHINAFFDPPDANSRLAGVGPADVHNRDPRTIPLVSGGTMTVGDGVLAVTRDAKVVFCQLVPWQFAYQDNAGLKRTFRRTSFLVTRLLSNLGAKSETLLLSRFATPPGSGESSRWLHGFYLDDPEAWDDPYRFFRW